MLKKSTVAILLLILLSLSLCLMLASCNKSDDTLGKYYEEKSDGTLDDSSWIELMKKNKWQDDAGESGTYEIDGTSIKFFIDGEEWFDGTIENGIMVLDIFGQHTYRKEVANNEQETPDPSENPSEDPNDDPILTEYNVQFNLNYEDNIIVTKSTENGVITYTPARSGYVFNGWWISSGQTSDGYILSQKWDITTPVTADNIVLYAEWVEEKTQSLQLNSPWVNINGATFSWQSVANSSSYTIKVYSGSEEISSKTQSSTSWNFPNSLDAAYYSVKIRANGDGVNSVNSSYVTKSYAHKCLVNVRNITFSNDTLKVTWMKVENAEYYSVVIDGNIVANSIVNTYYDVSSYDAGIHNITIGAHRSNYVSSSGSLLFNKLRLLAPKNFQSQLNFDCSYGLSWDSVKNADTYRIYINSDNTFITTSETNFTISASDRIWEDCNQLSVYVCAFDKDADFLLSIKSSSLNLGKAFRLTAGVSLLSAGSVKLSVDGKTLNDGVSSTDTPVAVGSRITITATTNLGYTWLGWYDGEIQVSNNMNLAYSSEMPAENKDYVAKWMVCPVVLEKNIAEAGTISGIDKTILGAQTTITASINNGYTFTGWYLEEQKVSSGNSLSYSFILTSDIKTYTAKWMACPVVIKNNIENAGTINGLEKTILNDSVTITAYANKDFNFIGWYDIDNNKLSDSVSYTFLLKEQIQNYIAKWEVNNKIYTKEELFNISDMKKSYQLMNDINLEGEEWTPLGTSSNPFAGLFVGNGYKIYNFKILSSNSSSVGFFGYISGEIIDLQICDFVIDVSSSTYSSNSWVDNYITAGSIGGILQNAGLIRNCYASGSIKIQSSGSSTRSSGGYYSGGSTVNVGGLIGSNSGKIYNCYSDIVIESSSSASSKTSSSFAYCYSGGIVGKNATSGIVSNCYALGTVKSVAYSSSYSTSSSAYASSRSYSGGIVGQNDGQIKNCFSNVQEITTASASPSGNSQSSIVRVNDDIAAYAPNTNSQILNCYKDNQIIINNTFFNDTLGFKLYLSEINMIFESDNVWSLIEGEFPKLYWQN